MFRWRTALPPCAGRPTACATPPLPNLIPICDRSRKQIVIATDSLYPARVFHRNFQRSRFCLPLNAALLAGFLGLSRVPSLGQSVETLPQTQPLTWDGDLSAKMVEGIDRFLLREIDRSVAERQKHWHRDFSSREAYAKSVQANR